MRRPEAEIVADAGLSGVVSMSLAGTARQMTLSASASTEGAATLLLPPLYEPQLLSMHGNGMIVRGWQRLSTDKDGNGATYLQEWLLTFVGLHPASGQMPVMREPASAAASPQLLQGR
ncbi:hypothetical protein [Herbaspirillum sp. RV1423]|uniref:hypothetical protein n=1 Tax=Herbaspirillum sp. RV1423 TaxID=1443993 RepID=UPI001E4A71B1|nr:hypothetical protein [Herbaspirillum sp. RV1423]